MLYPVDKTKRGYKVFDSLTSELKLLDATCDWTFKELIMPDGEIQRWFIGDNEAIILRYAQHSRK